MSKETIARLKEAIARAGKTPRAISLKAGMSDSAIRGVINNPNSSPTIGTIEKLARALDVAPAWLAYGVGETALHEDRTDFVMIRGEVAAGQWLDIAYLPAEDEWERAPIAVTPEWPRAAQYGLRVKGNSINRRAADGDILRCIDIAIAGVEPQPGDLVIVQRSRFGGAEIEVTAKVLRKEGSVITLEPDSTDPRNQPIVLDAARPKDGVEVAIVALVDLVLRPVRRG